MNSPVYDVRSEYIRGYDQIEIRVWKHEGPNSAYLCHDGTELPLVGALPCEVLPTFLINVLERKLIKLEDTCV